MMVARHGTGCMSRSCAWGGQPLTSECTLVGLLLHPSLTWRVCLQELTPSLFLQLAVYAIFLCKAQLPTQAHHSHDLSQRCQSLAGVCLPHPWNEIVAEHLTPDAGTAELGKQWSKKTRWCAAAGLIAFFPEGRTYWSLMAGSATTAKVYQ